MKEAIELKAYAKINLSIDVLARRSDGYHEVSMVMQQIELADLVRVEVESVIGKTDILVQTNHPKLQKSEENLATKAARLFLERFSNEKAYAVRIHIEKNIPLAAGLAGGSADAAAVLHALNRLLGKDLSLSALAELGVELGADVPFCLMGQAGVPCALASGIGEQLAPLPPLSAHVVLSKPPIDVSTKAIYKAIDVQSISRRPDTDGLVKGLAAKDFSKVADNMHNVLEPVCLIQHPAVLETRLAMERAAEKTGSKNYRIMMSGSGPTVFALTQDETLARELYQAMIKLNKETYLTKTLI